jgi:MYXO-CTERM domain-containing protein
MLEDDLVIHGPACTAAGGSGGLPVAAIALALTVRRRRRR